MHKGYKCLDKRTGRVYISRDAVFDESRFPFATPVIESTPSSIAQGVSYPQTEPSLVNDHMKRYDLSLLLANSSHAATGSVQNTPSSATCTAAVIPIPRISPLNVPPTSVVQSTPTMVTTPSHTPVTQVIHDKHDITTSSQPSPPSHPPASPPVAQPSSQPGIVTREKTGTVCPKRFTDGTIVYNPNRRAFLAIPTSHKAALLDPQ